jgi:very-short-patch-repair endonuclease
MLVIIDENYRMRKQDFKRKYRRRLILCNQQAMEDFMPIILRMRDPKGRFVKDGLKPMKGRKHKESTRKALSEGKLGSKNHRYGVPLSEAAKKLCGENSKKRWQDPMYRKEMVETLRLNGVNNIGRFKKGMVSWNKGKQVSDELREKLSKRKAGPFKDTKPERMMQITLALNGIKFQKHKAFKLGKSWHQVDIFIEPNIVVEVDGVHWHIEESDVKRDLFQTQELTILGYHIIRIRDKDILKNTQGCAETVLKLINSVKQTPNLREVI